MEKATKMAARLESMLEITSTQGIRLAILQISRENKSATPLARLTRLVMALQWTGLASAQEGWVCR